MVILDKCIAIFFSLTILGLSFLIRKIVGTWVFPACIFSLFWFAYTFFPLIFLFSVPIEPMSIGFILICNIAFSLGSLLFKWKYAFKRNIDKIESNNNLYNTGFLNIIFYVTTILSLIFLVLNSFIQGITMYDVFYDMFGSAAKYADLRYSEQINVNILGQLSLVFAYVGVVIGGFMLFYANSTCRRIFVILLSFMPSTFVAILQSAKGLLPLSLVLFYSGYLVCRISVNKLSLIERKNIVNILIYAVPVIIIFVLSFLTRGLYEEEDTSFVLKRLYFYFLSYSFAHIYAFSDWFSFIYMKSSLLNYNEEILSYGFYTFMALFKLFGSDKYVPLGVFDEYFSYGDIFISNIYTIYRGLILDFGVVGSLLYMFITGVLFHISYFVLLVINRPVFTVAIFVFMIGYFFSSFLISLLIWNSIYVSFIFLWITLYLNNIINSNIKLYNHIIV